MIRLRTIIVVSYVIVTLLFFTVFGALTYNIFFNFATSEISDTRLSDVNKNMSRVTSFVNSIEDAGISFITSDSQVSIVSSSNDITPYEAILEQREISNFISNITTFKNGIYSIEYFTDRYENLPQVAESNIYMLSEAAEESWYGRTQTSMRGWIPTHTPSGSEEEFFSYFHHMTNFRGDRVGLIKVNVRSDTFFNQIYENDFMEQEEDEPLFLINESGTILGDTLSEEAPITSEFISSEEEAGRVNSEIQRMVNAHELIEWNENNYLFSISRFNENRWRLINIAPIDSLYSEVNRLQTFIIIIGVVSTILLALISSFVGRSLIKPFQKMISGMKEVEKGNFSTRLPESRVYEYETLAVSFNDMTYKLDESLQAVQKENRAKRDAELQALQNQIVPHFLYNTLDMIHWRSLDYGAEDISRMVNQLSTLYRIGLSTKNSFIPLKTELEHVSSYVNLNQMRLNSNLVFEVDVSPQLKQLYVPKIILQPIVENSLKHGFASKKASFRKIIKLKGKIVEDELHLTIEDNGSGGNKKGILPEEDFGIGLSNIQKRISLYCGPAYGITLSSRPTEGFITDIRLPIIRSEEDAKVFEEESQHRP